MEMAEGESIFKYDNGIVRPAKSLGEAQELWWPLMVSLGWNRAFNDLGTYTNASASRGLLLAVPENAETAVGHLMATIYNNSTGWVTFFVVQPEHQGHGHGRALFSAVMQEFEINGTEIVGLDGVVQQKSTYERRGFVDSPSGKLRCMTAGLGAQVDLPAMTLGKGERLVDIKEVPRALLIRSDWEHTGFERKGLWDEGFFAREDLFGFALVRGEKVKEVSDIRAWTVVRRVFQGFRLGPVYAVDKQSARTIVMAAMERAVQELKKPVSKSEVFGVPVESEGTEITAEIWDGNPQAVATFEELGWSYVGVYYHRMWLNGKATEQQAEGGKAHSGMYAIFDAAIG